MKNKFFHLLSKPVQFIFFIGLLTITMQSTSFAQLAVYPLKSGSANPPIGTTSFVAAGVNAGTLISGTSMEQNRYNSTGYRLKTDVGGSTSPWPTSPTNGFGFDIPFWPVSGNDLHITGITLRDTLPDFDVSPTNFFIVPYFQIDGAGPWKIMNGATTATITDPYSPSGINFGPINETFYSGHTYVIRFYVYGSASIYKSDVVIINHLVFNGTVSTPAAATTVTTDSARATGKYTAIAHGSYDFNGTNFYTVQQSGFIWSSVSAAALTALDTSATTKLITGSAGVLNDTLRGLSAGTTYWVRAYIVTQFGIQYGATISFTTAARSAPIVTTNPVTNILSNKATGGGVIVDSGGVAITSKGMVWNFNGGATLTSNIGKVILNGGSAAFSDFMKQLTPGTHYCYRAFATNAIGTSYGADSCFTTAAAAPVLVAIPGTLDFGENYFGANPITVSYTLTGSSLTAGGQIMINIPLAAGFQISLSSGSGFGPTLTIPYTGTTLPRTPIFVRFPTTAYGSFTGVITHSGGGVSAANADVVNVMGSILASPDDVTNRGNDFWLGFGYQESMKRKISDASVTKMNVYITAGDQPATVVVEIPGVPSFVPQTLTIPANSVRIVTGFPSGEDVSPNANINSPTDARLFFTGVTRRGIHVYSTNGAPVSVWQHIFANNNSAGGSMIFPTNTWNSSYTVQSYAGTTNNGYPCNSFFYVIADAAGTEFEFTPSNDILDAIPGNLFTINNATPASNIKYFKGQTYRITLNRGEVFTAMGAINGDPSGGGQSLDLSGTTIKTTSCDKKIAVFCGNGRVITKVASCSPSDGSDNLIQQMFPTVAWGTRYLTVPTKGMEYNLFRIYIKDITTVVKVNGIVASPLVNGLYYETEGNAPKLITSDKPINVTQFILAGSCKGANVGNSANGDPEMIILSPIEQAVTKTVVYSAQLQKNGATPDATGTSGNGSFINVILKKEGLATFKIDGIDITSTTKVDTGSSSFSTPFNPALCLLQDAFKAHPQDAGYLYVKFRVKSNTVHILSSDYPFNAIAYGLGDGESYGYNAGTSIKNLSSFKISVNPEGTDSSSTVIRTCKGLPITLKIAFPYNPTLVDSIVWSPNDPRVSPDTTLTGPITGGDAQFDGTVDIDGRTFYIYTSPVTYTFSENALYRFKATAFGTFVSDCPGQDIQTILVNVGQDNLNLNANPTCNNPTVVFTADTVPMVGTHILSWSWNFGEGPAVTTSPLTPQSHTYPAGGPTAYTVKLTTKNSIGCISTDSLAIDFGGGLEAAFTISKDAVCTNDLVTFTDASFGSGTSGSPNDWKWNFDPVTFDGQVPTAQSWSTPGIKTISLTVSTPIGCVKTFKDTVTVEATPVAGIYAAPSAVCLGDSAAYRDSSTIAVGTIASWKWMFDDGTTDSVQNPKHLWTTPGLHTAKLTVKSTGGCSSSDTATHTINVTPLPTAGFKYDLNCTTRTITVTDTSNANGGTITGWNWTFGDVTNNTSTLQNPTHVYPASGTYTVTLSVTTAAGCTSLKADSITVTIAASPVADFTLPGNTCLPNASPVFTNTTTISDGTIGSATYIWNFGDQLPGGDFSSPADIPISPTHVFPGTGPYTISLTAISNNGCTNTKTKSYSTIFAAPVAVISPLAATCVNSTVSFFSASSTAAGSTVNGWAWNFGDGSAIDPAQNPTHAYTASGLKTVILTVTSAAGCSSAPDTIYVTVNALPTAGFTDTVNCSTFSAGFADASLSDSGTVNQWSWTFGDVSNNTSTVQNPTHVYPASGDYTVTLSVKTDRGCSSSIAFTNTVTIAARPVADFDLPGNTCLPNANAVFNNTTTISDGTINAVTYTWDFGDTSGIVASPPISPTHTYNYAANHTVVLTATSSNGCVKSISKLYDKVFEQPVAVITAPGGICLGNAANFNSSSSTAPASSVTGWQWDFGDTPASGIFTDQNQVYIYTGSGPRTVTLTVTSAAGCVSAPTNDLINVNLSPVAGFTYSAIRCKDSVITFNDASVSNATGEITEWHWDFGTGIPGDTLLQTVLAPATHAFNGAQSYNVSLSLKNANGCVSASAYTIPVVINPNPVSRFRVSDICIPSGLAQFNQEATVGSGQITGWDWNFGDSTITGVSAQPDPAYNYTTGGIYLVRLKVTSDSSCSASFDSSVTAYNTPTPLFDVTNPNSLCSNLPVSIVNKSVVTGFGTVDKLEIFWDYINNPTVKTTIDAPSLDAAFTNQYTAFGDQPSKSYQVLVRAYSGSGCSADYFTNINLLASPKAQFTQPAPVCQEAPAFDLTGGSDLFNLPGSGAYSGSGINSSPSFSPGSAGAGTHTIRYTYTTTAGGCTDVAPQDIVVNPTPVINFGRTIINVLEGDVLQLSPTITNGETYLWTPSTYLNSAVSATPSGIPLDSITYRLQVTSDEGCVAGKSIPVRVVRKYIVPNTFTPNHDGNHDRWEIENLQYYPDVRLRVFNRSGQMVFETFGYNTPWDGTYRGSDVPFGTYYYVIETGGGRRPKTGYVTIIR